MFKSEEGKRVLARSLTHYVYQNTNFVEKLHSQSAVLDMALYEKVYDSVYSKMKRVLAFQKYMNKIDFSSFDEKHFEVVLQEVPKVQKRKFLEYIQDVLFNTFMGVDWDDAEPMTAPRGGKNLAGFLLAGEFRKTCSEGQVFDDEAMERINKDVHNRMYTLVISSRLWKNKEE